MTDNVNHPIHYTQGGIECIEALKAATVHKKGIEAICVANVIKYLWRYEEKNGKEDVEKAKWYLEYLLKELSVAHEGEDTSFDYDFIGDVEKTCDECKYFDNVEFAEGSFKAISDPCAICRHNFVPNSEEYNAAPFNWEPKENK